MNSHSETAIENLMSFTTIFQSKKMGAFFTHLDSFITNYTSSLAYLA